MYMCGHICMHVCVHVCADTYVSAHAFVYTESLEYISPGTIHLGIFGQDLSLAGNSFTRLGCLAKKPPGT